MTNEPAHTHDRVVEREVVREPTVAREPVVRDHVHSVTDPVQTSAAISSAMIAVIAVVAAFVLIAVVLAWAPWNDNTAGTLTPGQNSDNTPSQQQQAPQQPQQQSPQQQAPQSAPRQP